jgi:PBP1b-binding outer membrane lipoprotein LpoB
MKKRFNIFMAVVFAAFLFNSCSQEQIEIQKENFKSPDNQFLIFESTSDA